MQAAKNNMIELLKNSLWNQFDAGIDLLANAIAIWPDEYWVTDKRFFYMAYHCSLFLDYYLSIPPGNYVAPLPFTLTAAADMPPEAIDDLVPARMYTKKELLVYVEASRNKCQHLITGLTEAQLAARWITQPDELCAPSTMDYTVLEILLYNMRHVQHHAAQLNLLIRNKTNHAPGWVADAK